MQITIDTKTDSHDDLRGAAAFLLHLVGDLNDEEADLDTTRSAVAIEHLRGSAIHTAVPVPPPPVPVGTNNDEGEDTEAPASNVIQGNFTQPSAGFVPPPPPALTANTAASIPPANPATNAVGAGTVVSVDGPSGVDSAGMTYDKRIHQKTGNKKKDGTWKLIKGIDSAIVAAVTAELALRKGAAAPVSLPGIPTPPMANAGTVPVPPVPPAVPAAVIGVPTPPVTSSVPVPPVAATGAVSTFRELIEKITAATKANQITPQDVSRLCQHRGAPNLMQLNSMPELLPKVTADVDAVLAGLSVDMVLAGLG